jgi:hypothetical protein
MSTRKKYQPFAPVVRLAIFLIELQYKDGQVFLQRVVNPSPIQGHFSPSDQEGIPIIDDDEAGLDRFFYFFPTTNLIFL